jgi:CheY-like chemotaxis protein
MGRILVVDDDPDSVEALCKYLEKQLGYTVDSALNGREALEQIIHKTPDLVILDLCMPELDGCTLLEVLRSYLRLQSLPVVMLTGVGDNPAIERVRRLNVNSVLLKGKATFREIGEIVEHELAH